MSEIKSFAPKAFTLDEEGSVKVAFSRLNVIDHDTDVTLPGAIPTREVLISAYGHTSWPQGGARLPVGKGSVREEGEAGIFEGRFFLDTSHGRDTYLTVKHVGELQEWSYGYDVLEAAPGQKDGVDVRFLKRLDIHEVSPVLLGAGIGTSTLAIKGLTASDHFDAVQRELTALISRAESLARPGKEGRVLSTTNRTRLEDLRKALAAADADIKGLLASGDPDTAKAARAAEVEYLLMQARDLGIPV